MKPDDLLDQLTALGIRKGMDLMVHSSLRRIGPVDGGADAVLDVLSAAIGPEGTLLTPTLTWSTVNARQPVFHVDKTPSVVGTLTEVFRLRPGARRSLHPTHSAAAAGPRADFYTAGGLQATTPCPPESPFGRLMRSGSGHILLLGVTIQCNTTIHAIEEETQPALILAREAERLFVIDQAGAMHSTPQFRHSCPFRHYPCWLDLEPLLHDAGALSYAQTGNALSRLIDAARLREIVAPILRDQPERMFLMPKAEQRTRHVTNDSIKGS